MTHDVEKLLGAYALGALDPEEQKEVELHLEGCAHCRAVLSEYDSVAEGLLHTPLAVRPSKSARAKISRRLRGEPKPQQRRRRLSIALAGGLIALLGVNLGLFVQTRSLIDQAQELAAQQQAGQAALAISSYPSSQVALVEEGQVRGTFVYDPKLPVAVMYIWGLGPAPPGQDYQVWLIRPDGSRQDGGLLHASADPGYAWLMVQALAPLEEFMGFGVTLEPASGSATPTGPRILGADL